MRIGRSVLDRRDGAGVGIAFWAIVLAMLPGVLDQTILATALPTIASDLGRLADVSWVVTAYVVAAAAAAPLWGKLGDRNGRKLVLEASLTMFLVASAVCGVAQSLWMLVVARGIQGLAAGGLMSLAQAAVGDLFFRALGGVVGAAVLGAVFTSQVGHAGGGTLALAHAGRAEVISGVHIVFLAAAPVALVALVAVLALEEVPLRGPAARLPGRR